MTIKERIEQAKQKEFISVEEVSLLLSIHPVTIYKKAAKNEVPGMVRVGRTLRFRRVVVLRSWGDREDRRLPSPHDPPPPSQP